MSSLTSTEPSQHSATPMNEVVNYRVEELAFWTIAISAMLIIVYLIHWFTKE